MVALLTYLGWKQTAVLVVVEVGAALVPLIVISVIGVLVGRVTEDGPIALPLATLVLLLLVQQALGPLRSALAYAATRRIDGALRARTMETANRSLGIAPLEDSATLDRLALAGGDIDTFWSATPGAAAVALVSLGARYLQGAGATLLLARVSVPLAVGLLAVVLAARRSLRRSLAVRSRAFRASLDDGRAARYIASLAYSPPAAKETRLFGLLDWLQDRHRERWMLVQEARGEATRWSQKRFVVIILALGPVVAAAFAAVGFLALESDVDARALAVALQATLVIVTLLELRFEEHNIDFGLEPLVALHEVEDIIAPVPRRASADAAGMPRHDITFEGVAFAYPGGDEVFRGLDLTVAAGSSLAIVGANGAGKTTLVKLLARLYEPGTGAISIDGVDVSDLDPVSWRRCLAVIFQDFVHYELPAADNVGFGGLGLGVGGDPHRRALHAAGSKAGVLEIIERLPLGWDTPLSRQYRGGAELSGGEWQRVALARALYAVEAGASVLVLDEPTANLDVRAEAELFERFLELTSGLTTIMISHRFSTVRRADRICVLEEGGVIEDGTHESLVAEGGRYAELFGLQAERFYG